MINDCVEIEGGYYSEIRTPMLSLIRGVPESVLEIGCASGQTMEFLRNLGAKRIVGVEFTPAAAERAKARAVGDVIVGDIESLDLNFPAETFDLIVAGHVLEHLTDPWKTLNKLTRYLRVDGQLVGALPNVRHHTVVLPLLLKGKWEYQPSGIMDWTHFRFFTAASIASLIRGAGLQMDRVEPEFGRKSRLLDTATFHVFREFLCFAFNFSAFKVR